MDRKPNRRSAAASRSLGYRTKWIAAGLAGLFSALLSQPAGAACQQPVYVIAHRCNGTDDVSDVVKNQHVNAVEADFAYSRPNVWEEKKWYASHYDLNVVVEGALTLDQWLSDVMEVLPPLAREPYPLALIIFDIKTPEGPLTQLYDAARSRLGPDINLLFSIGDFEGRTGFDELVGRINADPRAGAAIDLLEGNERQLWVQQFFGSRGLKKFWFADGYNAATVIPESVFLNVRDGVTLRDGTCSSFDTLFHGVYTWTYENAGMIKALLDSDHPGAFFKSGVNGVMVNASDCYGRVSPATAWDASDAVAHAQTLPGRKFAAPADNPFYLGPQITCPESREVECSVPGGARSSDTDVSAFLNGATSQGCDATSITTYDGAGSFYNVNEVYEVRFTATDASDGGCARSSSCRATITVRDTTPPMITCPGPTERDSESPAGTVVQFEPLFVGDVCDLAGPTWVCPESGRTFPVGKTTVSCTAMDAATLQASCSFELTILSPAEMTGNLRAAVAVAPSLTHGERTSLTAQLDVLLDRIAKGNQQPACSHAKNFIKGVEKAMADGNLALPEGQAMIKSATNLRNTLACSK